MTAAGLTFFGEDDLSRPWPSAPCSNPTRRRRRLVWRKMVPFWTWTKGWKEPMEIYSSFVYCWFWSGKDKRCRLFLWKQSGLNSQKQIRIIISTKQHGGFCGKGKFYQKPRVLLELHKVLDEWSFSSRWASFTWKNSAAGNLPSWKFCGSPGRSCSLTAARLIFWRLGNARLRCDVSVLAGGIDAPVWLFWY